MNQIYEKFFGTMYQFHKLQYGALFPDITKVDVMTLMAIAQFKCKNPEEGYTISDLAKCMHTKSSAVSRTLKSLEDKGLIERNVNKADRRITYVDITEKGKETLEACKKTMDDFADAVITKMNERDMERLIEYLDELYQVSRMELELRKHQKERKQKNE